MPSEVGEHSAPADQAVDENPVSLSGVVGSELFIISTSHLNLATTFSAGEHDGGVLVPLADWQIIGRQISSEDEPGDAFAALLPLENVAFLLQDMSTEFNAAVRNLKKLTANADIPMHLSVETMVKWLRQSSAQSEEAAAHLESLIKKNAPRGKKPARNPGRRTSRK